MAIIIYPLPSIIAVLCLGTALGAVVSYGTFSAGLESNKQGRHHRAGVVAVSVGVACLAVEGYGPVLGVWLWPLIVTAVVLSPKVLVFFLGHVSRHLPPAPFSSGMAAPPDVPVEAAVFAPSIRVLDNHDLCQAWGRSYTWLEGADSLALQAYIVTLRQAYLDELERRDPAGLGAWLNSGPRPRGGPQKFLHHGTDEHHLPA
ncbi:hypothetical protein [Arthrobacter sp. GMC3]|uniref:hypothetical protein n=1 Tax=Arthrobacter sp. GMC3 TaxID=2058894 RepID=UPI000CE348A3|nr:hypothetical protein [Arthrobacter sp. GMC3]